ncbi:Mariner transposase [Oopsacas minuta]|uniref:Mariner transposase n=1 Tax=Oopsacas minuta TaxID=111878 RepID=A0AAV7KDM4_9METZ|nr:Mariner transposase [Oopsacas minuta]
MNLSVRSGNKAAIFNLGASWRRSPVKVRRARSVGKKMVAPFFCKTGPVAIIPLEDRRAVNADWYINNCLPKACEAWSIVALRLVSEDFFFTTIMHLHTQQPKHWTPWLKIRSSRYRIHLTVQI